MNDLISRTSLLRNIGRYGVSIDPYNITRLITQKILAEPEVDAEPVRHGRYGFVGMDMMAGTRAFYFGTCSECHERINFEAKHKNYCPNCGARMRGDNDAAD